MSDEGMPSFDEKLEDNKQRRILGEMSKVFTNSLLWRTIYKEMVDEVDDMKAGIFSAWTKKDAEKQIAHLTGKREGIMLMANILSKLFVQGSTAKEELEDIKERLINAHR